MERAVILGAARTVFDKFDQTLSPVSAVEILHLRGCGWKIVASCSGGGQDGPAPLEA